MPRRRAVLSGNPRNRESEARRMLQIWQWLIDMFTVDALAAALLGLEFVLGLLAVAWVLRSLDKDVPKP